MRRGTISQAARDNKVHRSTVSRHVSKGDYKEIYISETKRRTEQLRKELVKKPITDELTIDSNARTAT